MRFTDFLADLLDFGERDKDGNIVVKSGLTGPRYYRYFARKALLRR